MIEFRTVETGNANYHVVGQNLLLDMEGPSELFPLACLLLDLEPQSILVPGMQKRHIQYYYKAILYENLDWAEDHFLI